MTSSITINRLYEMKQSGEKIAVLTAYDASFATLLADSGVEVLLVGDSLGTVVQGGRHTLAVTVDDMVYHTRIVAKAAAERCLVVADMPFMSYATPERAMGAAARLMGEGGAQVVKLEGGAWLCATVEQLTTRGVPVCAHLGLTPQSVHKLGGYKVQGRSGDAARTMVADARALEAAGAGLLVLECIPAQLAAEIAGAVEMPVIGIGAGPGCDGQVLVLHDLLGVSGRSPRMSRNFLEGNGTVQAAVKAYVAAVKSGEFPGPEQSFE
jgi:3-methyl-2-oxobutanoate hydroxymethyltransferase